MIKSYKNITGKYLRLNRKRTALTLVGIILSVALISAIGLFFKSIEAAEIRDAKSSSGSYHIAFTDFNDEIYAKIKANPRVVLTGTYRFGKEQALKNNFFVRETYLDEGAFKLLPIELLEGRFPKSKDEVVLEKWVVSKINRDAETGDRIKVFDKEYKLVGILSDIVDFQRKGIGNLITIEPDRNASGRIMLVELKADRHLSETRMELRSLADEKTIAENFHLLGVQERDRMKELIAAISIIIAIVMISTIAVIYNSFQISVVERYKQFGLLRAVGATPAQIRKIVLREASFLSLIGVPIGLLCGVLALYGIALAFKLIGGRAVNIIAPTISPEVLLISIAVSLAAIYASALLPSYTAGRVSPLIAISSRSLITKEKIKRRKKTGRPGIFGFEGTLAFRNMKRNRRRYRVTIFSIVISIVLFIVFKSFMDMSFNVTSELNESKNIHFSVVQKGNYTLKDKPLESEVIQKITSLPEVKTVYNTYNTYNFDAAFDKSCELAEISGIGGLYKPVFFEGKEKTLLKASIVPYDRKALETAKAFLKQGKIDADEMNRENGVIVIARNRVTNPKTQKYYYGPLAGLEAGDEIVLQGDPDRYTEAYVQKQFGTGSVNRVKVLGVLRINPFNFNGSERDLKIITTEEMAQKLTAAKVSPTGLNIILDDAKLEKQGRKAVEEIISSNSELRMINFIDENRNSKSSILMVQILLYGFIVVVSLIGSINIINTLTTNIILRRRELASLKAIGLTQNGLKKMIKLEGIFYGIVGSIYGSVIGTGITLLIYRNMNEVREQAYPLPITAILIASAGAVLIGYLSVLMPLKRIKDGNLIETIREDY